jgi:serine/threonine-protein kinase
MSSYIDLYDGSKFLGKYDLPDRIVVDNNNYFALIRARKSGGNGVVFEARHYHKNSLKRNCALKLLRRLDAPRVDRFNNEARIVNQLSHGNIASYYANGEIKLGSHNVPWIAQELGGRNMREHVDYNGSIKPDALKKVGIQMCSAVEYLHSKNFIHRDIKPDNFVWAEGSAGDVLMIDLGIAKRIGEDVSSRPMDMITRTLDFVGPVFFSSPELIAYAKDKETVVDHRSDIFQLGKTFWYLATGQISAGVPSRALCPMGGRFRELVLEMVDDDPNCRFQTISSLVQKFNLL